MGVRQAEPLPPPLEDTSGAELGLVGRAESVSLSLCPSPKHWGDGQGNEEVRMSSLERGTSLVP